MQISLKSAPALLRNKKKLATCLFMVLIAGVLLISLLTKRESVTTLGPVIKVTPDLQLVKVTPAEGDRSSLDAFTQTFFEFSAGVDEKSAKVSVTPEIPLKVRVYLKEPNVLVIEPLKTPWQDKVEYTINIKVLRGINGEELRQPIEYKFSNTEPAEISGGDFY